MGNRSGGRKFIFKATALTLMALGLVSCSRINFAPVFHGSSQSAQEERGSSAQARNDGPREVRVRPGDTLSEIALRNDVPTRDLARANGIRAPFTIFVGQELTIPGDPVHQVARGESLSVIAARYDMTTRELARANDIQRPYTIYAGQELNLPWAAASNARSNASSSRNAASPTRSPRSERLGFFERLGIRNEEAQTATATPTNSSARPTPRPRATPISTRSNRVAPQPAAVLSARSLVAPPQSGEGFMWPVDGVVLSGYGPKSGGQHNDGINIAVPVGTPVRAAEAGVVIYQGNQVPGYGSLVLVRHADGYVTTYAHNSRISVRQGQVVERGERIALSGRSGRVSQPQVHFEVRRNSDTIDPARILAGA